MLQMGELCTQIRGSAGPAMGGDWDRVAGGQLFPDFKNKQSAELLFL
jgi:hypothetical protein